MIKKIILRMAIFFAIFLTVGLMVITADISSAQNSCPQNTKAEQTQAVLVGEITDDGGDPNLEVWFDYGRSSTYTHQTNRFSKYGLGLFCSTIYNLEPCATYHYRAVAKNSSGVSYGENKTFTTKCVLPSVDLKVNNSDGPVSVDYNSSANISWTSTNATACVASGSWSGSKLTAGSESTGALTASKTYTLTCTGPGGSASDSVMVNVISPATIDLKVNNSDGPISVVYDAYANLSWTSQNVVSCEASGDWSGYKMSYGAETFHLNSVKTYVFTITCKNHNQTQTVIDTVQVIVKPKPPVVITKPAIITL